MSNSLSRAFDWFFRHPYLLVVITMLSWSGNFVVGRGVRGDVPPVMLASFRWGIAALILLPFALPHLRRDWPVIRANLPILLVLSFFGITSFNTLVYVGLQDTTALNGLLFQSSAPIFIAIFSFVLFREPPTLGQGLGIAVSLGGVAVIATNGDIDRLLDLAFNPGDLWILFAFAAWGIYCAVLRKRPPMHWLSFVVVIFILGLAMLVPFQIAELASGARLNPTGPALFGIAYIALFPAIVAYICNNRAIELLGANTTGTFYHLIPVLGSAMAIFFLGEQLRAYHVAGFALVMAGIGIATLWPRLRARLG
jgi:drug/metabolite transporter (DMT)-like permease